VVTSDDKGNASMAADPGDYKFNIAVLGRFNDATMSCAALDANGNPMPGGGDFPIGFTAGQGGATISQPGDTVTCTLFFYNSLDGALNPPPKGISGQVLLCETNFAVTGASSDSERAQKNDCVIATDPITLTLTKPDGTTAQATSDASGNYAFGALPVGVYALKAEAPSPHTGLLAYCDNQDPAVEGIDSGWIPDSTTTGTINIEIKLETAQYRCRLLLYNPDGGDPNKSVAAAAPQPTATTPPDDNQGGGNGGGATQGGGNGGGATQGGGNDGGATQGGGNGGDATQGGGNGGGATQGGGATNGASIRIKVFGCPNGFSSTNLKQLRATCKEPEGPVPFTLSGSANQSRATGSPTPNEVLFDGLAAGRWTISVAFPEGFALAKVFCGDGNVDPQSVPVIRDNSVRLRAVAGQAQTCEWFNITKQPSQVNTGGNPTATLTLTLHSCPPGYNPDAVDADPVKDCTELTDNVNISATDADGLRARRQTGETQPGVSVYDGLATGTYRLHQGYPKGVGSSFILSCTSDKRELTPLFTPLTRIDKSGSVKITLEAPENMACDWYNIPSKPKDEGDTGSRAAPMADRPTIALFARS
jgi:hypothetical protein